MQYEGSRNREVWKLQRKNLRRIETGVSELHDRESLPWNELAVSIYCTKTIPTFLWFKINDWD
jgi:hypothetical protein